MIIFPTLLIPFIDLISFISCFCNGLPLGRLYFASKRTTSTLFLFISGLFNQLYLFLQNTQLLSNSLFLIAGEENALLNYWLAEYGLPNDIFTDVSTPEKALQAILLMNQIPYLITKQDYIDFFAQLGYTIEIYYGIELLPNGIFPSQFPVYFGIETLASKFFIYVRVVVNDSDFVCFPNIFPIIFPDIQEISLIKNILPSIFPANIYVIVGTDVLV